MELRERHGTTVFLTTYYLEEADRYAERVMVMTRGRMLADDTAARLKAELAGDVVTLGFANAEDARRAAGTVRRLTGREVRVVQREVSVTAPDVDRAHEVRPNLARDTWNVLIRELRPVVRDPFSLIFSLLQPLVLLGLRRHPRHPPQRLREAGRGGVDRAPPPGPSDRGRGASAQCSGIWDHRPMTKTARRLIPRRLVPLLALPLLAGCAPGPVPPSVPPSEPSTTLNDVLETSDAVVDEIVEAFPGQEPAVPPVLKVYACPGEADGIGYWIEVRSFTAADIPAGVSAVREAFADIETSYGTSKQDIEYADGTPWSVPAHHVLLEDDSGSYLLTHNGEQSGMVSIRTVTACGALG